MGQHYLDPIQYILGKDAESPVRIEVDAPQQHPEATSFFRRIQITYVDGCRVVLEGEKEHEEIPLLAGPQGKVFKGLRSTVPHLKDALAALPNEDPPITDFSQAVRTRKKFALHEENGHRSATLVNLAKIAWQLGRTLRFDPTTQRCPDDEAANRLINPPMRAPWHL
jgi:hypothetical protein